MNEGSSTKGFAHVRYYICRYTGMCPRLAPKWPRRLYQTCVNIDDSTLFGARLVPKACENDSDAKIATCGMLWVTEHGFDETATAITKG